MIWVYLILLLLHVLCCIFTLIGIHSNILNVHKYMFFIVLFLPLWGIVTVLILHFQIAIKADGSRDIGVEKMKLDSEIYKSITVDDKHNADSIVPIEEALLINNPRERREIIMDVLNDNPKEYIEFLQKAGNNEDTEVVHYAVTAMVEISKENDYKLQQLERKYSADPENYEVLTEYCDFLWNCLEQNLMQGQVEIMNRNLFSQLAGKKTAIKENVTDFIRLAKNNLKLKNYTEAGAVIEKIGTLWPENEEYILLKLEYYASLDRGNDIKKMLDEIESKNIYISSRIKEAIAFWKN